MPEVQLVNEKIEYILNSDEIESYFKELIKQIFLERIEEIKKSDIPEEGKPQTYISYDNLAINNIKEGLKKQHPELNNESNYRQLRKFFPELPEINDGLSKVVVGQQTFIKRSFCGLSKSRVTKNIWQFKWIRDFMSKKNIEKFLVDSSDLNIVYQEFYRLEFFNTLLNMDVMDLLKTQKLIFTDRNVQTSNFSYFGLIYSMTDKGPFSKYLENYYIFLNITSFGSMFADNSDYNKLDIALEQLIQADVSKSIIEEYLRRCLSKNKINVKWNQVLDNFTSSKNCYINFFPYEFLKIGENFQQCILDSINISVLTNCYHEEYISFLENKAIQTIDSTERFNIVRLFVNIPSEISSIIISLENNSSEVIEKVKNNMCQNNIPNSNYVSFLKIIAGSTAYAGKSKKQYEVVEPENQNKQDIVYLRIVEVFKILDGMKKRSLKIIGFPQNKKLPYQANNIQELYEQYFRILAEKIIGNHVLFWMHPLNGLQIIVRQDYWKETNKQYQDTIVRLSRILFRFNEYNDLFQTYKFKIEKFYKYVIESYDVQSLELKIKKIEHIKQILKDRVSINKLDEEIKLLSELLLYVKNLDFFCFCKEVILNALHNFNIDEYDLLSFSINNFADISLKQLIKEKELSELEKYQNLFSENRINKDLFASFVEEIFNWSATLVIPEFNEEQQSNQEEEKMQSQSQVFRDASLLQQLD